jgi:putative heme-binding domain-containing protein
MKLSWMFAAACLFVCPCLVTAQTPPEDPFALGVRTTEPVTAAEQQKSFQLPEGFRIQLVAGEPQIAKPMNLAFDGRGRLWVSSSEEYPFAAAADATPRDSIRILEDTNGDALADKVTVFADKLNIPIGLLPWQDGVICFSIPNIWLLRDTDGDNVCDHREVLYGPFDTTRDTHGMCNAFRRGDDGWIYACHGFNNRSEVAGRDGHKVTLTSGNTFRFRPDGSRIELYTQGQVNPFGMAIDAFGDIYTADCHTKPVTLLLPGGCYDSFGRPHDGLGYVPNVMDHLHGSTAIAALALGAETLFPADYAQSTFDGNVMTSRVNQNRLQRRGSSVRAVEQPDLVSSSDPWFRPVDLVAGPDGALYIADFYNRIIGHYEVDLKHPGRDRFRGRIWRVSWSQADTTGLQGPSGYGPDLTAMSTSGLMELIQRGPLPVRRLARDRFLDQDSATTATQIRDALTSDSPALRQFSLRTLATLQQLKVSELQRLASDPDETVRVHVYRALRELPVSADESASVVSLLQRGLGDESPLVRRATAAAASIHRTEALLGPLLRAWQTTELGDVHLRHALRIALRDHLLQESWLTNFTAGLRTRPDIADTAEICLAVKSPAGAAFVAQHLHVVAAFQPQRLPEYLQYAAAWVAPETADQVVTTIRAQFQNQPERQVELLTSMARGFTQRGEKTPASVRSWALEIVLNQLQMTSPEDLTALQSLPAVPWTAVPYPATPESTICWGTTQSRRCQDGVTNATLYSSFEAGETRTGIWKSAAFPAPRTLSFFIAGHDGIPDAPLKQANSVKLRDHVTGKVLRETPPPRNDVAQKVEWTLEEYVGQPVVLELVDGDSATAYAWLAVGRFSEATLNPSDRSSRQARAAAMIADFQLHEFQAALQSLVAAPQTSRQDLSLFATALARIQNDSVQLTLALVPTMPEASDTLIADIRGVFTNSGNVETQQVLSNAFYVATASEQTLLAEQLASSADGAEILTSLMEGGRASARLLLRPSIQQRLLAIASAPAKQRLTDMLSKLPNEDATVETLLAERRRQVEETQGNVDTGKELFRKNCQVCHQLGGEGRQVGPNLDGIANRGLQRMLEDVLAPNRNVDVAFRTTTLVTTDGKALSGLVKELEQDRLSLTDSQAKETILNLSEVEERKSSTASPMPANFGETLTVPEFRDLIAFLQTQRQSRE